MLADYIDPFWGVDRGGHTLCGPYLPHSIVRLGPDLPPPHPPSGYRSDAPIAHFSHTHVSGTGGGGRYGNVAVMPYLGTPRLRVDPAEKREERAEASYYSVVLEPSRIHVELTSTPRVGLHRYTFPEGAPGNILIDLGAVIQTGNMLPGDRTLDGTGACVGGAIEWVSTTELAGRGDYRGGWGHSHPYSVYFFARFDRPAEARILGNAEGILPFPSGDGPHCAASARFDRGGVVGLSVGISYVSVAKARASLDREAGGKDFDAIRREGRAVWEVALGRIRIEGASTTRLSVFYSAFARLLCMPSDLGIDDEFPAWHAGVRHFTDYYTTWDSVRNANALLALIDPELEAALLNCLLDVAGHTGWLPDAWIAGHSAMIQGGSSADILFCEAALKGIAGIDYAKALHFMRKNNEVESPDPRYYGRFLKDYRERGYLTTNVRKNCVSRHIEYAYQDWCIAALAQHLGHDRVAAEYGALAQRLWNLWREDLKCFAPRTPDGAWAGPFDPDRALPDSWNDPYFYEGTSRQWSFCTQHDFAGLVARHGGAEAFIAHLDAFFDGGFHHSKETMLHTPYLYTYAGRPDRTCERVGWCLDRYFREGREGLSDNEDMGCQSAFYMCASLGLYPMMGQPLWLLSTPRFAASRIELGRSGPALAIEAEGASEGRAYIASATLNGAPLNRAWLAHDEIANGGTLAFRLSATPTDWGRNNLPFLWKKKR